jgi:hypothetical protein
VQQPADYAAVKEAELRELEAITRGRRNVLFGSNTPSVLTITPPDMTVRVPEQYFAVEARAQLLAQTDIGVAHPDPGTSHDFAVYLSIIRTDEEETRDNVDTGTFVQTPTTRVTHRTLAPEVLILEAASPGPVPEPTVGAISATEERIGFVLLATFTWDGVAGAVTITQNTVPVVSLGSTGLPSHGAAHVSSDPIPYPTNVNRGMMPPASLPYLKNALNRMAPAAGSPIVTTQDGTNGPAGDTNYNTPYSPGGARGYLLDVNVGPSLNKSGSQLNLNFGTPPGGAAGVANAAARSDHKHFVFPELTPLYYNLTLSDIGPFAVPMDQVPLGPTNILIDPAREGQLAIIQVEMICSGPDTGPDNRVALMHLVSPGSGHVRYASCRASGSHDATMNTTTVIMPIGTGGNLTVQGLQNINSSARFRISVQGYVGQ